ncbi:MAG: hypothetical protein IAF38_15195 [Bacteroidia bacterium]|nr:hypothetical protein [Bacteroidia bacterium]
MKTEFQLFGSEDSIDYDVMIFVETIPEKIDDCHTLCKNFSKELSTLLSEKPLNINLAVVENGNVVKVFKGTADEVNNALFYTYNLHSQHFPKKIASLVERNADQKFLRATRVLLSFFSRTKLRSKVKEALRGDLREKVLVLKEIDFLKDVDFPVEKNEVKGIYKTIAFQMSQTFSLFDGYEAESYTKKGLIKNYSELKPFLNREEFTDMDLENLNRSKIKFLELIEARIDKMQKLRE